MQPSYALAKGFLVLALVTRLLQGWGQPTDKAEVLTLAQQAIASDPDDPSTLRCAGHSLAFCEEFDRAITILKKAAELNVNGSQIFSSLGWAHCYACVEPLKAIEHFERAMRLSPRDPEMAYMLSGIAFANLIAGRYVQAEEFAEWSIQELPQWVPGHRSKITALWNLERLDEARAAAKALLRYDPGFTISTRVPKYGDATFQSAYH